MVHNYKFLMAYQRYALRDLPTHLREPASLFDLSPVLLGQGQVRSADATRCVEQPRTGTDTPLAQGGPEEHDGLQGPHVCLHVMAIIAEVVFDVVVEDGEVVVGQLTHRHVIRLEGLQDVLDDLLRAVRVDADMRRRKHVDLI